jgi:hypothetical protein
MKYFGILTDYKDKDLSDYEIKLILNDLNLFEYSFDRETIYKLLISDFNLDFKEVKTEYTPSVKLMDDFIEFNYIVLNAENKISKYFIDFNEKIYGLNQKKQKRIALESFIEIYESFDIEVIDLVDKNKSKNGIVINTNEGKLYKLYMSLSKQKVEICTYENMISYLFGNIEYYDETFYSKEDIIDCINIYMASKILSQLNDIYKFEIDKYFTEYFSHKHLFFEYNNIFYDDITFHITMKFLKNLNKSSPSYVYAIYEFLRSKKLIRKNDKNFLEFIFKNFDLKISKIHKIDKNQNEKHLEKLDEITFFWDKSESLDYLK